MKTPLRLSLFAVSLAAVFGAAWGAGTLAGPVTTTAEGTAMASHNEQHEPAGRENPTVPGGLQIAQDGYQLHLLSTQLSTTVTRPLQFTITGPMAARSSPIPPTTTRTCTWCWCAGT